MSDNDVQVTIKPWLPGQWRWKVKYGRSWLNLGGKKVRAGVGFGKQDAINRAKAFLEKKGIDAVVPGDADDGS